MYEYCCVSNEVSVIVLCVGVELQHRQYEAATRIVVFCSHLTKICS